MELSIDFAHGAAIASIFWFAAIVIFLVGKELS